MGRPRMDGKPTTGAFRIGKPRATTTGSAWRVRAYQPTTGAPYGRVTYRNPETGKPTSSVPKDGQGLDELFDIIERALDKRVALGPTTDETGATVRRDIRALGDMYIARLQKLGRSSDYLSNRRTLLNKWVYPVIGDVLVLDWSVDDSESVLVSARPHLSASRVEDLGSTLSGLRETAHRKRVGGRWLDPDDNPLEGVSYGRNATIQGAHRNYVQSHKRPATQKVEAAIEAAGRLEVWEWMPEVISLAAFCAPRLAEQLGLRAIDVNLAQRTIDINGVWKVERKAEHTRDRRERFRVPHPKNKLRRHAPYRGSQHEPLLTRVTAVLGLPAGTPEEVVVTAVEAERSRRAGLTPSGDWRDLQVPAEEEPWLFPDDSGVPPNKETFNDAWHKVRDESGWTKTIPYKNLRHHAALWWKDQGFDWVTIAAWDGHDHRTLQAYYVLVVENATEQARAQLDAL